MSSNAFNSTASNDVTITPEVLVSTLRAATKEFSRGFNPSHMRIAADFRKSLLLATSECQAVFLDAVRPLPGLVDTMLLMYLVSHVETEFGDKHRYWLGEAFMPWIDEGEFARAKEMLLAANDFLPPERQAPVHATLRIEPLTDGRSPGNKAEFDVRLGVPNMPGAPLRYDVMPVNKSHPVAFIACLSSRDLVDQAFYRIQKFPGQFSPGPLDRFHPERFKTYHPSFVTAQRSLIKNFPDVAVSIFTEKALNRVIDSVMADYQRQNFDLPRTLVKTTNEGSVTINQAVSLSMHNLRFIAAGRQIYDLPPALVERFRETDVDDVPLSMLRFPYSSQYIYWGAEADLELEPGWKVDGAYVQKTEVGLELLVTSVPDNPIELTYWPAKGEPYFYQRLDAATLNMSVGAAVDTVLAKDLAELRERASKQGEDIDALLRDLVDQGELEPLAAPEPGSIVDVSPISAQKQIDRLLRRHDTYEKSLKLVINALCYLTAYPDDAAAEYPQAAPRELVLAAENLTDFKRAKNARGRLADLGYTPTHICGKALIRAQEAGAIIKHEGRHVRAHWRRGHWRRQAFGEQRAQRRLVWLMPVLVGKEHAVNDPDGHIYLVSGAGDSLS